MGEIIEEFFNGYCRNFDMTQTVICEFEQLPEGIRLLDSSCEYEVCQYSKDCTLMKQALAREKNDLYTKTAGSLTAPGCLFLKYSVNPIHHIPEWFLLLFF